MHYQELFAPTFAKNYKKFQSLQPRIDKRIDRILANPLDGTEALGYKLGTDLRGLRSARIDRNFRIIFCIWKEYLEKAKSPLPHLEKSQGDHLINDTIIFMTVGPHEKVYKMK